MLYSGVDYCFIRRLDRIVRIHQLPQEMFTLLMLSAGLAPTTLIL